MAERIIAYTEHYPADRLASAIQADPAGAQLLEPLQNPAVKQVFRQFYRRYYANPADPRNPQRHLILGINPGRLGAGLTGIPFTDPYALEYICRLGPLPFEPSREISASFLYQVITGYGGPERFYRDFLLQTMLPLGLTVSNRHGRTVNYNFYDSKPLQERCETFIIDHLETMLRWGIHRDAVFCLGKGKNYKILQRLNQRFGFFERIVPLEHPRYIVQYRSGQTDLYQQKYLRILRNQTGRSPDR